jgi:hypothetical protein
MKLYRPSNGTEGDCFMGQFCERCVKDDPDNENYCDILANSMAYGIHDPQYPREWVRGAAGPTCTAFERRGA